MRPARFLVALLFGAAVLITFLKLLFFVLMVAAVVGAAFFAARTLHFLWTGAQEHRMAWQGRSFAHNFGPAYAALPIQPLDAYPQSAPRTGRIIEVL